jgi:hypothetical protein
MVKHWHLQRASIGRSWIYKACINGVGAVLTFAATLIELVSKFLAGAWLVAVVVPLLVVLFLGVRRAYTRLGVLLEIGKVPAAPQKQESLVVVPVAGMSRLTAEGVSAALSLGDDVIAVTVVFTDGDDDDDGDDGDSSDDTGGGPRESPKDVSFRDEWRQWRPEVPLVTLRSAHRSIAKPIVAYLRSIEQEDRYHRLVVLIPEVQPVRAWQWLLHNQRGLILDRTIRRGTENVVLCRLRYRLSTLAAPPPPPPE